MSRKGRERRERYKTIRADDYFSNGTFEVARFGKNTLLKNNCTFEQQKAHMDYLQAEYPAKYKAISEKINKFKEKVMQCDPYNLLMYLRFAALSHQINVFSESEYTKEFNAVLRAQEYIQSVLVSEEIRHKCDVPEDIQEALYEQVIDDFNQLYSELQTFYFYWAAYIQKATKISDDRLHNLVEAQYMYWVRGNRYQVFELEPLKKLLPPHNAVLRELFGVSSNDIIHGLEKLQHSLSQGYADAMMELAKEYDRFVVATVKGVCPEEAIKSRASYATEIMDRLHGSGLIDVKSITGWDTRFIEVLSYQLGECHSFRDESDFSGWPIVEQPVMRRPFIKIDGTVYAFLYYAIFDNIYRNIQKTVARLKPEYAESWKNKQAKVSEEMVASLFNSLLPGAEVHIGNYYPINTSTKKMNENDIIIIYMNHLFIIEVKAGSFPSTPPITDFEAHIRAYQTLVEKADSQCSRTLSYISRDFHPHLEYSADDFSIQFVNSQSTIIAPFVSIEHKVHIAGSPHSESLSHALSDILTHVFIPALGKGAEYSDQHLHSLIVEPQVSSPDEDIYAQVSEFLKGPQYIQHVPSLAAERFDENQINLSMAAKFHQGLKLSSVFHIQSRYSLREITCIRPVRIPGDILRVVLLLLFCSSCHVLARQ